MNKSLKEKAIEIVSKVNSLERSRLEQECKDDEIVLDVPVKFILSSSERALFGGLQHIDFDAYQLIYQKDVCPYCEKQAIETGYVCDNNGQKFHIDCVQKYRKTLSDIGCSVD